MITNPIDLPVQSRGGQIIDWQDDVNQVGWRKIAKFWPRDMPKPPIGQRSIDASDMSLACVNDGYTKVSAYPIESPEQTLASAMYWAAFGVHECLDKEAAIEMSSSLLDALIVHQVSLPNEFLDLAKTASLLAGEEYEIVDVFVDEYLPVTTLHQARESAELFKSASHRWSSADRAVNARKLSKVAERFGFEFDHDLAMDHFKVASTASHWVDRRQEVMSLEPPSEFSDYYILQMETIKQAALEARDEREVLTIIEALEDLDKQAGLHDQWGHFFPDPADSILLEYELDPNEAVARESQDKYASAQQPQYNWESIKASGILQDSDIEMLKQGGSSAIEALPTPLKLMLERHIQG